MVGLVVVSHSPALAEAAVALAIGMAGERPPRVATAAGVDGGALGTDAVAIQNAIEEVDDGEGVVILVDLGSAVLSSELALELIDPELRKRVHLTSAPLVEGLVAAIVQAAAGEPPEVVVREAVSGLMGKQAHLGDVTPSVPEPASTVRSNGPQATFTIANPHGLHARPAARLVATAKRFDATVQVRNTTTGSAPVPATSLSRVAALGALQGHELEVVAVGEQAAAALDAIVTLASRMFDEKPETAGSPAVVASRGETALPASPGVGIGPKWTIQPGETAVPEGTSGTPTDEWRRLGAALAATHRDLVDTVSRTRASAGEQRAAIFEAHDLLLDDDEILATAEEAVATGATAARAWRDALDAVAARWEQLDDPYMRARAADVRTVRDQVLRRLQGLESAIVSRPGILVAAELTPNETAQLDATLVTGIVTVGGSPTSHAAILARALGIPAVVGADAGILELADGTELAIDGDDGTVLVAPTADVVADYEARAAQTAAEEARARRNAQQPAVTSDGAVIEVAVNMGSVADTPAVVAGGADSVGLVRTEFLFLDRPEAPSVDEQEAAYLRIAAGIGDRHLTIRTLDVGGDKTINYLVFPDEANPFLGMRGIRLSLREKDLFRDQLTALIRVARERTLSVLFPMVSSVSEIAAARGLLDAICRQENVARDRITVGMMVEVPAVAANAAAFCPLVDFFSIGTNDLTQYALAAERGNSGVAHLSDALDPGVLRLIKSVVEAAAADHTRVAVCGEIASDLAAIPVLVGLGIDELSVTPNAVPRVKAEIRRWSHADTVALAAEVISLPTAAAVRAAVAARTSR